jgi:hypothetical protein
MLKKTINLLVEFLKDNKGIDPGTAMLVGSGIMGGSSLLGGLLGKSKGGGMIEPFPGYFGLGSDLVSRIREKMKTPGMEYPGILSTTQPEVERVAESTILGKLGNLPSKEEYTSKLEAAKTQQIAREKERAATQKEEESNMYNRLGLVSSTPWLTRAGELGDESLMRQKDIETGLDLYGLEYNMNADKLIDDIANRWISQGQVLGQSQRGYQQNALTAAYNDWLRAYLEPYQWATLGSSVLGSGSPMYSSGTPNIWSNLATTGQNIGQLYLMSGILGK